MMIPRERRTYLLPWDTRGVFVFFPASYLAVFANNRIDFTAACQLLNFAWLTSLSVVRSRFDWLTAKEGDGGGVVWRVGYGRAL